MSITLFFLVAIGLLAATWSLCFVGCGFPTGGLPGGPSTATPYSNLILKTQGLLAYWPLNDVQGSGTPITTGNLTNSVSFGTAADQSGNNHNGTYIVPPAYPNFPASVMSASIGGTTGTVAAASSIVPGDAGSGDMIANPGSADCEGGYVNIPWNTQTSSSPQLSTFTLEAWIAVPVNSQQKFWVAGPNGVVHVLFGAIASDGTGVVIGVDNNNSLQIIDATGAQATGTTIDPTNVTYIAVSFDGSQYSVFVQGIDDPSPQTPAPISGAGYTATAPSTPVTFFIGAGRNGQMPRTANGNLNGGPANPFMGQIQSVALYSSSSIDSQSHFANGSGG